MTTKPTETPDLAGAGQKLLAHSKSAAFTARRGLAVELYPFIFGASARMSAPAISDFLAAEQGIQLSAVTINKAIKAPAKNWNLYFDMIEPAARVFEKDGEGPMRDFLFREKYLFRPVKSRLINATLKALLKDEVVQAASILRTKWFNLDWDIRLKARPYLEDRLGGKGGA
jgi:hypothetical protein